MSNPTTPTPEENLDEQAQKFSKENINLIMAGQPTKYRSEYCQLLIEFVGNQGFSYEAFAGYIGVHRGTLYDWEKAVYPEDHPDKEKAGQLKHPEYADTKKIAFDLNRIYWEKAGRSIMFSGSKDVSPVVWIFNMKNRFKWRDNVDVTTDGQKVDTLNGLLSLINPTKAGSSSEPAEAV